MDYDPYDTPPFWLRLGMCGVCLLGAVFLFIYFVNRGLLERSVAVGGGMLLAAMFIFTSSTGAKAAGWTVAYWALLIGLVLTVPI